MKSHLHLQQVEHIVDLLHTQVEHIVDVLHTQVQHILNLFHTQVEYCRLIAYPREHIVTYLFAVHRLMHFVMQKAFFRMQMHSIWRISAARGIRPIPVLR